MIRATCLGLASLIATANLALAGGPCSGVKGGCGRSSYRSSSSSSYRSSAPIYSSSPSSTKKNCTGSTSVKGHYRDGHWVSAHTRCTSGSNSSDYSHRSTARTSVRTKPWNGTSSTYDDDDEPKPFELARPIKHAPPPVPARFFLHLKSGRRVPAVQIEEKGNDYIVHGVSGGQLPYPKSMVDSVETVAVSEAHEQQSNATVANLLEQNSPATADLPRAATVKRVRDGETIELAAGDTVRLLGVDTPKATHLTTPTERLGREAKAFTTGMLEGQQVKLVYDPANSATNHRDTRGRLLAYVFRHDGVDVNALIIKMGYARAYTQIPFARSHEFRGYEALAREQRLGLWETENIEAPKSPQSPTSELDPASRPSCRAREADQLELPLLAFVQLKVSASGPTEGIASRICGG